MGIEKKDSSGCRRGRRVFGTSMKLKLKKVVVDGLSSGIGGARGRRGRTPVKHALKG